jgi:endonuclease/exonuclease/phosphatase family metal-dependent hydrolase
MRIATYNVEWFNALFDDHDRLIVDDGPSARYRITRAAQIEALGIVFTALDADAVMVVEAPDTNGHRSTVAALESFAAAFRLRARRAVMGFANETQQEIAFLYDPDRLTAVHDPKGPANGGKADDLAPRFDGSVRIDANEDGEAETIEFSKPPLELAVTTGTGASLRVIGVHVKSKVPHGPASRRELLRQSVENRVKQIGQCMWLRRRVEEHLDAGDRLIVLGDFNDGPGLDGEERMFGRSGVEVVLGEAGPLGLMEPHARMALSQRVGAVPATARFYLPPRNRYFQALIDFVMLSPNLARARPVWRIWHPFDDPVCYEVPELREALLTASDHFPVSVDLEP